MRRVTLGDPLARSGRDLVPWIMAALREIELASHAREERVDTDTTLASDSDDKIASQKAIKAYVDGRSGKRVLKTADETTASDTTLSDDAILKFTVAANTKYHFRLVIFYDTPTAADFKYDVNGPASPTLLQLHTRHVAPGATAYAGIAIQTAFAFGPTSITETSGTNGCILIDGILHNGANAGTVAFRWAQNTSNGSNTTVRAGSYLEWSQVG